MVKYRAEREIDICTLVRPQRQSWAGHSHGNTDCAHMLHRHFVCVCVSVCVCITTENVSIQQRIHEAAHMYLKHYVCVRVCVCVLGALTLRTEK